MDEGKEKSYDEPTLIEYARMHLDHDRLEHAEICAAIAQAIAAERQAAALERIATVLETMAARQ